MHTAAQQLIRRLLFARAWLQASSRARAHDVLRNVRSFLQTQTRANVPLRDVLEMLRTTMPQENISDSDVRT